MTLFPRLKPSGFSTALREPNSAYQVAEVRKYLEGKGLTCKDYKFSDSNDVTLIATQAANECDAIYIPTDNTAASSAEIINGAVLPTKTPIIAGEAGICEGCGIATLSISYEALGYVTGEMAAKVLTGEEKYLKCPLLTTQIPLKSIIRQSVMS